ncbi:MAG: hypothetical protein JXX14_10360 [Deltaproteobacteria bacterium]|nr:hypothetical protein [Deltaproteobacteria bacterium]
MTQLLKGIAPLMVLCLIVLSGCMDHASLEGAACPCADGYVCCDGVCRTSCSNDNDSSSTFNESTDTVTAITSDTTDTTAVTESDSAPVAGTDSVASVDTDSGSEIMAAVPLPCDVFEAAGVSCVAAHSTVRVLRAAYTGPLYELCKGTANPGPDSCQGEKLDIGAVNGYANATSHAAFCQGSQCTITKVYDQAPHAGGPPNDLEPAPKGGAKMSPDRPANATDLPVTINGHQVYGLRLLPGVGYRAGCNDCTIPVGTDLATGDEPQTIYMITSQYDTANGCCFDYGNAETSCNNDHNGTAEALYFGHGVIWGTGSGEGPWVMADLEDGLYAGWENAQDQGISTNVSAQYDFVTAIMVGDTADKNDGKGRFALYAGDAQTGPINEMYDGIRPEKVGYVPMQKQGSLVLGIAGDNSNGGAGRFYEAAIVNAPLDKSVLDNLQSAIVQARYGKTDTVYDYEYEGDTDSHAQVDTESAADSDAGIDTGSSADTDSVDECENVSPCGGDVVGTWNVTSSCLAVNGVLDMTYIGLGDWCDATITGSLDVTGTWTANEDGTFTDNTATMGAETIEMSADCLNISGTTTTCDRMNGPIGAAGFAEVECVDNPTTGGCTCATTVDQAGMGVAPGYPVVSGPYENRDSRITIASGEQAYTYCVKGSTMRLSPQSNEVSGPIIGGITLNRE